MSISARRVSEETLFGPGASDSMAWHLQRGRAPALGAIAHAHELATVGGAGVPAGATRAVVTKDGVYTLYFSQK